MNAEDDRDALDEALAAVEHEAQKMLALNAEAQRQFIWAQANRLGLLWVHAASGIVIGSLMLVFGTASTFEDLFGLWVRPVLAFMGIYGGACVAAGLAQKPLRNIRLEAIGMTILALWDLAIMTSLVLVWQQHPPVMVWPWEPLPDTASRVYPVAVYGTLFALLGLHVYTLAGLAKMRKPK